MLRRCAPIAMLVALLFATRPASANTVGAALRVADATVSGSLLRSLNLFALPSSERSLELDVVDVSFVGEMDWVSRVTPSLTIGFQLGRTTSDEHQARRFHGLLAHGQSTLFETVNTEQFMVGVTGEF